MISASYSDWRVMADQLLREAEGGSLDADKALPELPTRTIQAAVKQFRKKQWLLTANTAVEFCDFVFREQRRNETLFAIYTLTLYKERLPTQTWDKIETWVQYLQDRDLCDELAINLAGRLVIQDKSRARQLMTWSHSRNGWARRFAVVTMLVVCKKGGCNLSDVLHFLDDLMSDEVQHVQTAVAWTIHQLAKMDEVSGVLF